MADERAATQLPLFEDCEFFPRSAETLPATWLELPEKVITEKPLNFEGRDLRLVAPHQHRTLRLDRDDDRMDQIRILGARANVHPDDVWMAYTIFAGSHMEIEIFEHFVSVFEIALRHRIAAQWVMKLKRDGAKLKTKGLSRTKTDRKTHNTVR